MPALMGTQRNKEREQARISSSKQSKTPNLLFFVQDHRAIFRPNGF